MKKIGGKLRKIKRDITELAPGRERMREPASPALR
jgi:hypothetical protein